MTLGERIRKLRNENHLTQLELAQKLGVPYSYIHPYEHDKREIPLAAVEALAHALNTTSEYLLGLNEKTADTCEPSKKSDSMIGKKIKELRKMRSMSAEDLGAAIGKDRATIYRYENGELDDPPISVVLRFCDVLRVTPSELLGFELPISATKEEPARTLSDYDLWRLHFLSCGLGVMILRCEDKQILSGLSFVSTELINIVSRVDSNPNKRKEEQV